MRVGIGSDVHRLEEKCSLVIGGVEIPFERGLAGHSDADVLIHAVIDALLGAMGEDDIGQRFPPADHRFKGISSMLLLDDVAGLMRSRGYTLGNLDAVIVAQEPRLAPYLPQMKQNIARVLHVQPGCIGIKATTSEGLGFCGRGEGIAAQAVALLIEPD